MEYLPPYLILNQISQIIVTLLWYVSPSSEWLMQWFTRKFAIRMFPMSLLTSGTTAASVFVSPFTLEGGRWHYLTLSAWTPMSHIDNTTHRFLANLPPYGGTCSFEPSEGEDIRLFYFVVLNNSSWCNLLLDKRYISMNITCLLHLVVWLSYCCHYHHFYPLQISVLPNVRLP